MPGEPAEDELMIGWRQDRRARFFHRVSDSGYSGPGMDVSACSKGWLEHTTTHRELVPNRLEACQRCFPKGYRAWMLAKLGLDAAG